MAFPRVSATVLCCCAAALAAAGCGSSAKPAGGPASGAGTTPASAIKVVTTPKYGTPPASAPVLSGVVQIAYRNIAISPDTLRVRVGTTLRWTNYDAVQHNVTSQGPGPQRFASGNFGEGGTYSVTVTRPGVIHYLCTIHPASMNGTIAVVR